MLHRRAILVLLVAFSAIAVCGALLRAPGSALSRAELGARDFVACRGRLSPPNPKLIFLAIDSDSVSLETEADLKGLFGIADDSTPEARALSLMSRQWPWPRNVHALILDRLVAAGAKAVVYDLIFPMPAEGDEEFRAALERHRDRVVIGSNFNSSTDVSGRVDVSLTIPANTLIPQTAAPDARVGFVNFWPDADGTIRSARFHANFAQFLGAQQSLGESSHASLAAQAVTKLGRPETVPADGDTHPFRFTAGPERGFPPHSVFEIFVPGYWERNYQSGRVFDGAIVVIGAAGNWQHDEHETPFGVMSGPEIQLNVMNALLHGEFLRPVSWLVTVLILFVAGTFAVAVALWRTSPLKRIALLLVGASLGAAQFPLFDWYGVIVPVIAPLIVFAVTGLFSLVHDLIAAGAEQLRLRRQVLEKKREQEILTRANAELEGRVAERTAELTQSNTALTGLLEEKTVLLKEIHHRVKNNMQVISSLLSLQAGHIKDAGALEVFTESRNRVRSMALVHEKLYQTQDLSKIDFQDYLKALTSGLVSSFMGRGSLVKISSAVDEIMLGVDAAVPCGLIVNELVTNCFKYAFPAGQPGEIRISMKRAVDAQLQLSVSDNGVGFPHDVDFRNTESLGMQLVTTLADQLEGSVAMRNGCGTTFEITFPEAAETKL